ncbi:hypothetical protein L6250_00915 [Candidatus Parcubacteria bacterium]|nr:hypothetical protein [Patescibacteria group bacterium]MCG2688188.1 hypothetical protein [Candidatus Parcubacteria bacterium]
MKFKINKQKVKKGILFLKNFPWLIGENAFLFFVIMISIAILISAIFFVRYVALIDRYNKASPSQLPTLNEETLKDILETWQQRQNRLDNADNKAYPNFFLPKENSLEN